MTTIAEKAAAFRALHVARKTFIIANAWDAGSACHLTSAGFVALATTSAGAANVNGLADGNAPAAMIIDNARQIAAATHLPVSADLLDGFGAAPETVAETIGAAAAAGMVGGSIEDTSYDPALPLYERGLAIARIEAAVAAARSLPHDFVLTARCDGFLTGACDLAEAITRIQAYQRAGADVLYIPGISKRDDIAAVVSAVDRPVNVLVVRRSQPTVAELAELGVVRISLGSGLYNVAMGAVQRAIQELTGAGSYEFLSGAIRPSSYLPVAR